MILSKNGKRVFSYEPSYVGEQVLVAIDSSKSNSAIVVADEFGDILDDYEISGAGSDVEVYQLCYETRKQLRSLFDGAKVLSVGIENIITKNKGDYRGMEIHSSRIKITAVFDSFIFYFQDYHNITPHLINNQSWKMYTLPEEYRSRNHKKGSKDYFDDIGGRWAGRKDDITDVVCIMKYLINISEIKAVRKIKESLPCDKKFDYMIFPVSMSLPEKCKIFEFNSKLNIIQNVTSTAAMLSNSNSLGYFEYPTELLSMKDIYSNKLKGKFNKECLKVNVVVEVLR